MRIRRVMRVAVVGSSKAMGRIIKASRMITIIHSKMMNSQSHINFCDYKPGGLLLLRKKFHLTKMLFRRPISKLSQFPHLN